MLIRHLSYLLFVIICLTLATPGLAVAGEKKYVVGFHNKPGAGEEDLIHKKRGKIRRKLKRLRSMAVDLSSAEIASLKNDPRVAYVEEDARIMAIDPLYAAEYTSAWGVEHIGSATIHDSGNKGAGVKIAILDTGIDYNHPEFQMNYRGGIDFVNGDDDPMDDNSMSHGTHIAGVMAAAQDGNGVVGVAPEADIYAVKVIEWSGFGSLSHIVAGIDWAIDNQVDIINMSLGFGTTDYQSLREACDAATAAGILVVAATGNSYGKEVMFPAAYDSVIAVNGTDPSDQNAAFSSIGPEVELTAPATGILSTVTGGGYSSLYGTSQASAHVSGLAALMISAAGEVTMTNEEVRLELQQTALDLGEMGRDTTFGFGRIDAIAAVAAATPPEDDTEGEYILELLRISDSKRDDIQKLDLPAGKYIVEISNEGLRKINIKALNLDNGAVMKSKNLIFHKTNKQTSRFLVNLRGMDNQLLFAPKGKLGSSASVKISMVDLTATWHPKIFSSLRKKLKDRFAIAFH